MAAVTILPAATYVGTVAIGPLPIPAGVSQADVSLDRMNLTDPVTLIGIEAQWSPDGSRWFPYGGAEIAGGVVARKDATGTAFTLSASTLTFPLPQPSLATRQLRATMTITGTATTSITVALS